MRLLLAITIAAVVLCSVSARVDGSVAAPPTPNTAPPTPSGNPVVAAAWKLQAAFSNVSFMTGEPGLGSLFTSSGTWCSQMGAPCVTGASNITAYVTSFKHMLGIVDSNARFTGVSVTANYGSFDYVKTFTCTSPCGPRSCMIPGKSGFSIDQLSGKIVELDDYVDANEFETFCASRCSSC